MFKRKRIFSIYLSIVVIFVFMTTLVACGNTDYDYSFANYEYRTDTDALTNQIPDLGSIDHAYWKIHVLGSSPVPGPSSYKVVGFIVVDDLSYLHDV